jgi:hypothetical protein
MTYAEAMARDASDFWTMLWPLYLLIAASALGAFVKWITPRK